jgi:hypothetical protein
VGDGRYWSIEDGGWQRSPGAPDALATPWARRGVDRRALPFPLSAAEVLRSAPERVTLPAQSAPVAAPVPAAP